MSFSATPFDAQNRAIFETLTERSQNQTRLPLVFHTNKVEQPFAPIKPPSDYSSEGDGFFTCTKYFFFGASGD